MRTIEKIFNALIVNSNAAQEKNTADVNCNKTLEESLLNKKPIVEVRNR